MPTDKRRKAEDAVLLALACGATVENVARQCNLSERTIYKRLNDPVYKERLQEIRNDMVSRTAAAMTAAGMESLRTLLELQKKEYPAATRRAAARDVLEIGIKMREDADLADKVQALQQAVTKITGNESGTQKS